MVGKGGEVFVLDMGEQIKVIDIARDLIRLSGHTEEEIDIVITGLSAGEKMHEELFYDAERAEPTAHAEIMVSKSTCALDLLSQGANGNGGRQKNPHDSHLQTTVTALIEAAQQGRVHDVVAAFHRLVPQYRSPFGPGMEPVTPQPASYNDEERG
jgi:FlaA1/EpsC-like NDP-sugar epimerase